MKEILTVDYKIIEDRYKDRVELEVVKHLLEGWSLAGGVCTYDGYYAQAVWRAINE